MTDSEELKLVFEGSSVDAEFVANILEDSGISVLLKNKTMGSLFPHYATTGGVQPVKIFVKSTDFENASGIIEIYFDSRK